MLTIEPFDLGLSGPVCFMPWMAYLQPRNTPSELTACTRCQVSTSVLSTLPAPPEMPALLTMMSSRPSRFSTSASSACQDSSAVTSCCTKRPPLSLGPSVAAFRSATTTAAPASASNAADCRADARRAAGDDRHLSGKFPAHADVTIAGRTHLQ